MHLPFNKLPLSYSKFFCLNFSYELYQFCPAVSENQIHMIYYCGFCMCQSDKWNVCMSLINCNGVCVVL